MERPSEAAADASAASCTYSQVVFTNIPHSYTPSTPITCCYNLNAAYQPNSRDWVGIFKVSRLCNTSLNAAVDLRPNMNL